VNRRPLPHALAAAVATLMLPAATAGTSLAATPEVDPELAVNLQAKLDLWRVNHRAPGVAGRHSRSRLSRRSFPQQITEQYDQLG